MPLPEHRAAAPPPARPLDPIDRRIFEFLQEDGRMSFSDIAADLEISLAEVQTRVDAMIAAGVFDIVAVTDPLQLGYPRQAMLGVVTDGPAQPVGLAIARIDEVIYQALTTGGFDVLVEIIGTSDAHLLELVARIRRLPGVTRIHTFLYQELVKETYTYGSGADHG